MEQPVQDCRGHDGIAEDAGGDLRGRGARRELLPAFNIRDHAAQGFGSYESAAQHGDVVWRFSPDAADHARRFVFHPTQTVEEEPDGSLLVRIRASGHLEMCWHLYSWGRSVEVLQPAALRELVQGCRRDFDVLP